MKTKKLLLLLFVLFGTIFSTGCSTDGEENSDNFSVTVNPGVYSMHTTQSQSHKFVYAHATRDDVHGSIINSDKEDSLLGGVMIPSTNAMRLLSDARAFFQAGSDQWCEDGPTDGTYTLLYHYGSSREQQYTRKLVWPEKLPRMISSTLDTRQTPTGSIVITSTCKFDDIPSNASLAYCLKVYQHTKKGRLIAMGRQTSNPTDISVDFRRMHNENYDCYAVLECLISVPGQPVLVFHHIFDNPIR